MYMKNLLLVFLLLAGFTVSAQVYLRPNTSYGLELYRIAPDSVLHTPKLTDTLLHTVYTDVPQLRTIGDSLWFYSGIRWHNYGRVSGSASATWGAITGVLSDQLDLQAALDAKVPNTRTITINGVTFDLSANRTWTVGGVSTIAATGVNPIYSVVTGGTSADPILNFTLLSQSAYTILGNNTGSAGVPSFFVPTLASALFRNQGSTTTVLHGNAAGNPSWSAVDLSADVIGNLPVTNLNGGTGASPTSVWTGNGTWQDLSSLATTWQQTLIVGSTLTQNNTIIGGSHALFFSGNSSFTAAAGTGYLQIDSSAKTTYLFGAEHLSISNQNGALGDIAILANLLGNTYSVGDSIVTIDNISKVWKKVSVADIVSAGGGGAAAGNTFDIQMKGLTGLLATPGSDSLYYQSGLSVKGKLFVGPRLTSSTAKVQISSDSTTQPLLHIGPPSLSVANNLAWVNFTVVDSNVTTNSGMKAVGNRFLRKTIMGANGVGLNVRYGGGIGYELAGKDSVKLTPANSDGVAAISNGWQFTKASGQTTRTVIQSGTGTWDFTPTTLSTMQANGGSSTNNFRFRGWFANYVAYLLSDNGAHTDSIENYAGFTSTGAAATLGLKVAKNYDFFSTGILGGDGSNIDSSWANFQGPSVSTIVRNYFSGPTAFDPVAHTHTGPVEAVEIYGSLKMVDGNQGAGFVMLSDANGKGRWVDTTGLFSGGGSASSPLTLTSTTAAQIPLTLVGASAQTGHLLEFKDNGGGLLSYFGSGGGLKITGSIDNGYVGAGPEIEENGAGQGVLRAYNRTGGAFQDWLIDGLNVYLRPSGSTVAVVSSTGVDVTGLVSVAGTSGNTFKWAATSGTPSNTITPVGFVRIDLGGVASWLPYYQ